MIGLEKKLDRHPADDRQWVDPERAFGARPTDKELAKLRASGFLTVVQLNETGTRDEEESRRAARAGMNYQAHAGSAPRVDAATTNALLDVLNERHNGPFYVYDSDGRMAGVMALLFKAIPNFWSLERFLAEAKARSIDVDFAPGLMDSIAAYLRRYVRGRR